MLKVKQAVTSSCGRHLRLKSTVLTMLERDNHASAAFCLSAERDPKKRCECRRYSNGKQKVMSERTKRLPRWQAKRRSNSHSQPPSTRAQHQPTGQSHRWRTLRKTVKQVRNNHSESRKDLFARDLGFMYMTSISTYPKKKRSSTSTPLEGLVLPLSSIMIVRVSNICSFGPQCLYSSLRKWKISSPPKPEPALSITNFSCIFANAGENKVFAIVFKPRKWRRELEKRFWRVEVKTLLLMRKKWKTEWYSQLLKEAAITCQNDHLKERKISEDRKK